MRWFIRHPADIPIVLTVDAQSRSERTARNVSKGGLAIKSGTKFASGTMVEVNIPFVDPPFRTRARVAWCVPHSTGFHLGVEFLESSDAFRGRMVEQVCYIQNYRK